MKDTINIGPVPYDEPCAQVGTEGYAAQAKRECKAFIEAIRTKLGPEPDGARLYIKSNPHDAGTYYEVECSYDDENQDAADYAFRCESDAPKTWEEAGMKAPRPDDTEFEKNELIPVPANGRQWLSDVPDKCQIDGDEIKNEFIDGRTIYGAWAIMCPKAHAKVGCGLGEGCGQRYKKATDGNFYKVEG